MEENFEKDAFRKRAADEYYRYKSLNDAESFSVEEVQRGFRGTLFGCLFSPVLSLLGPLGKRALNKERQKRNYASFESKARSLLIEDGICEAMREAFQELPKDEIVTEDIFVRVFTETLSDYDLRQRFDIPLDPVLFALVGYGIFKMGIREYCGGKG